jgi:ribonuclease HII
MSTDPHLEETYRSRGAERIAGVDEAGRGPLAGPVVAAAVVFSPGVFIPGVDDSKVLSPPRREALAVEIRAKAAEVGVGVVPHDEIDRINILRATNLAMEQAVRALAVPPDLLLIDGNSFRHDTLTFVNIVDGDALCFSIAAASIIAKVERDRIMMEYDRQYPEYGFAAHKGYGTEQHRKAIAEFGLSPIHRKSFRIQIDLWEDVTTKGTKDTQNTKK